MAEILVAEDNPLNFELVRDLLDARGHTVEWARDGEEALAKASSGKFDLLLLDLHMPRLDGLQVVRMLRATPRSSGNWDRPRSGWSGQAVCSGSPIQRAARREASRTCPRRPGGTAGT